MSNIKKLSVVIYQMNFSNLIKFLQNERLFVITCLYFGKESLSMRFLALLLSVFIVSCGGGGSSPDTNPDTGEATNLSSPNNFNSTAGVSQNSLSWDSVANVDSYIVYWSTTPGVSTSDNTLYPGSSTQITHDSLNSSNTYYYIVTAIISGKESEPSAEIGQTPFADTPWTLITKDSSKTLFDMAWNGSRYVAVGINVILTSTDGNNWTELSAGTNSKLRGVIWANNQFVAVGENGKILISPDGLDWTGTYSNSFTTLVGVAWTGTNYVTVSYNANVYTSPDGINWSADAMLVSAGGVILNGGINDIVWTGTRLVVVGEDYIATSPDGFQWTGQTTDDLTKFKKVIWTGTEVLAVGPVGVILSSADGLSWTHEDTGISEKIDSITYTGSEYLIIARAFDDNFYRSSDRLNWTALPELESMPFGKLASFENTTFAYGTDNIMALYTP